MTREQDIKVCDKWVLRFLGTTGRNTEGFISKILAPYIYHLFIRTPEKTTDWIDELRPTRCQPNF